MADKYAVFLDVDGTLATMDNFPYGGKVTEANTLAIAEVRRRGHYVFINTGRSYAWIPKPVLNGAEYDGVLSGIGTSVVFRGQSLFEDFISREVLRKILEIFLPGGKVMIFGGMERVFVTNPPPELQGSEFVEITAVDDFETKYPNDKIQKVEIFESGLTAAEKAVLEENLSVYYHGEYTESWNRGCSKSRAMKIMAERLGIPIERCIAMGDSVNDVDVLKTAGIAVVMGNAPDDVKEIADYVTGDCDEDGVAQALEKLILKR